METMWIHTASALPANGQPVQFMLHKRESPISGVYAREEFCSRWTHYAPALVSKWRGLPHGYETDGHDLLAPIGH